MEDKDLSIIIPVYNEAHRIKESLHKTLDFISNLNFRVELIVVDDGSTDNTVELLKQFRQIRLIRVWPNRGKGNAIKTGVSKASGKYILFMDADLATPLIEIPRVYELARMVNYDLVVGSRIHQNGHVKRTFFRSIISAVFNTIKDLIIKLPVKDSQCGFKIFRREVAYVLFGNAKIERWSFDVEILYLAQKLKLRICEFPVQWEEKSGSKVKFFRDAFIMLKDLLRIRYYDTTGSYNTINLKVINERQV